MTERPKVRLGIIASILRTLLSTALFSGALAFTALPTSAQQTFSRNITFCALDIGSAETAGLLELIRTFHQNANRDQTRTSFREELTLQDGINKFETENDFSQNGIEQGPERATSLYYSMSASQTAPISRISLRFGNHKREITISGADRDLVYSLSLLVDQEINKFGCAFGGTLTRIFFTIGLFVLGNFLAWVPWLLARRAKVVDISDNLQRFIAAISLPLSLGLIVSVFVLPWSDWLAGTVIRIQPTSIWDRIAPFLVVLGVLLSLGGFSLSALHFFGRSTNKSND